MKDAHLSSIFVEIRIYRFACRTGSPHLAALAFYFQ